MSGDKERSSLEAGGQLSSEVEQQPPPKSKGKQPARDNFKSFSCEFCSETFLSADALITVTLIRLS